MTLVRNTVSHRDPTKLNHIFPRKALGVNITKSFKELPLRCCSTFNRSLDNILFLLLSTTMVKSRQNKAISDPSFFILLMSGLRCWSYVLCYYMILIMNRFVIVKLMLWAESTSLYTRSSLVNMFTWSRVLPTLFAAGENCLPWLGT